MRALAPSIVAILHIAACGDGSNNVSPDAAAGTADAAREASPDAGAPDAASTCAALPPETVIDLGASAQLSIAGEPAAEFGIFDPSIVYPSDAPAGAMSYSSVPNQHAIRTHIAISTDHGANWTHAAVVNTPTPATVDSTDNTLCPGGMCSGQFINEVSSLIIDPDDPDASQRWKLFAHRYLASDDDRLYYPYGTIALYTAPAPEGPWSAPIPLLGWRSSSSVSSAGVAVNVNELPGMGDCLVLTEPGALWLPGSIHLAVGCAYPSAGGVRVRIELLRSVDHAATFTHVGRLLDEDDARCVGGDTPNVNAAALFTAGGAVYLAATVTRADGFYRGCQIYRFADLASAALERHDNGTPIVRRRLTPPDGRFNGACGVAEGLTASGILQSVLFVDDPPRVFRIIATGVAPP